MITKDLDLAIESLNRDDVIAIPTETVYGLAGNIYSERAIKKIFALKKRPYNNPLIVHIHSISQIEKVAKDIPEIAFKLTEKFWPGPLTLILNKQECVPDLLTGGNKTVAVRVPNHPIALSLLKKICFPLAAPSANPFGSISPTTSNHVFNYFNESLDVILEGGECERGVESTIIGFDGNDPILYRHGSISIEEIEALVGKLKTRIHSDKNPESPGMHSRHYAPRTVTYMTTDIKNTIKEYATCKIGVLLFDNKLKIEGVARKEILSEKGDFIEAAKNFYAALHRLDNAALDIIILEKLPDFGLGKTLNDRLYRAVKK
jgi:L-threonylcarbamoyladenylate synthase